MTPPTASRRLHITGPSGAGTTTLGAHLARSLSCAHFDTDDFYWLPTDPPFRTKRPADERLRLLATALAPHDRFVLSGSLTGWGDPLIPLFTAVIFLDAPTGLRLDRLHRRESARFGAAAIAPGGPLHQQHREFLAWAASYDDAPMDGRSRRLHESWLARLKCPVIRARGDQPLDDLLKDILDRTIRLH